MNRTNHGTYLFGIDPITQRNCDHRKDWMECRLQLQAACFAIDLLGYSFLSNHFHQVLRSRPDIVASWSDEEVARRWLTLCPEERDEKGIPLDPTEEQIERLCRQKNRIKEIRVRLSDISWWMRLFNQTVAQWVNREEGTFGHLWQGRFKAVRLLDEVSLLACMVYVDLNPIRAALAETIEASRYSSAHHRVLSLEELKSRSAELEERAAMEEASGRPLDESEPAMLNSSSVPPNRVFHGYSGEMINSIAPVELKKNTSASDRKTQGQALRCSDNGFLDQTEAEYVTLLDWTARQLRTDAAGHTPPHIAPLFERLNISEEIWLQLVRRFRKHFGSVAGGVSEVVSFGNQEIKKRFRLPKRTEEMLKSRS